MDRAIFTFKYRAEFCRALDFAKDKFGNRCSSADNAFRITISGTDNVFDFREALDINNIVYTLEWV